MDDRYVEFNSVCMVLPLDGTYPRVPGKHTLLRIADIDNSGKIVLFNRDPNKFSKYENKIYILCDNGPSNPGSIGVWHWTAKPNTKNPEKDYVQSNYIDNSFYKIIIDRDIIDIHQLVLKLKNGIQIDPLYSNNSIIYAYGEDDSYIGILLQKDNFEKEDDYYKLKDQVCKLKYYRIKIEDTCKYQDSVFNKEHVFLQSTILPKFEDFTLIREVEEYISKLFFNRLCWNDMKNAGFYKKDFQDFKAFLQKMPVDDFSKKIASEYVLSSDEAENQIKAFIDKAESFFNYEDVDSKYIDNLVYCHPKLRQKCIELISAQKESVIESLNKDIEEKTKQKQDIEQEIQNLKKTNRDLKLIIEKQEADVSKFEETINSKISAVHDNVSDFYAQISLMHPFLSQAFSNTKNSGTFVHGQSIDDDKVLPYSGRQDLLENIRDALSDVGIDKKMVNIVSAFLLSAWENRIPVLLAGPSANEIADAMSIAIHGKFADRIKCLGNYSKIIYKVRDAIVVINNIFYGDWISHIDEMINNDENYYYVTNNFVEDLLIEPKGIFNFMIPFLTDVFISKKPKIPSFGGKRSADYEDDAFEEPDERCRVARVLSKIGASKLFINNINQIMVHISDKSLEKEDLNYYFVYLPYLLLTNQREYLIDNLKNNRDKVSSDCYETISNYLGINE